MRKVDNMTTRLDATMQLLSKDIGDYWAGTTTGTGTAETLVDSLLKSKANDWIGDAPQEHMDRITSGTYDGEERAILSLDNTSGTLTVLSHSGIIASSITYEIHRLFSASEKRRALIAAAKEAFPSIYRKIRDTSKSVNNWLENGDAEIWTLSTTPDDWVVSGVTCAKNTTSPYYSRGVTSARLSGTAGYHYQSNTENPDLIQLAGKTITFSMDVWGNVANDARISLYDGTTTTYSDYHAGNSAKATLSLSATIAATPSTVRVAIHRGASSVVYWDNAKLTGVTRSKIYVGDLGLALNYPHNIEQQDETCINEEPWTPIRNYEIGSDGYLYLHEGEDGFWLRINGIGYLDFLVSGVASELWTATIDIEDPQTRILTAQAATWLFKQLISPNYTSGEREKFVPIYQMWQAELNDRIGKFAMKTPMLRVSWGININEA